MSTNTNGANETAQNPEELSETELRQGDKRHMNSRVLVWSTLAAVIAAGGLYIYFA